MAAAPVPTSKTSITDTSAPLHQRVRMFNRYYPRKSHIWNASITLTEKDFQSLEPGAHVSARIIQFAGQQAQVTCSSRRLKSLEIFILPLPTSDITLAPIDDPTSDYTVPDLNWKYVLTPVRTVNGPDKPLHWSLLFLDRRVQQVTLLDTEVDVLEQSKTKQNCYKQLLSKEEGPVLSNTYDLSG
jgi:hypothetical protein